MLGTVLLNNVDAINRPVLKNAVQLMGRAERGSWVVVHVLEKHNNPDFEPSRADNCGYVVFIDRKVVTFHNNDLGDTSCQHVKGKSDHTLKCTNGLAPL